MGSRMPAENVCDNPQFCFTHEDVETNIQEAIPHNPSATMEVMIEVPRLTLILQTYVYIQLRNIDRPVRIHTCETNGSNHSRHGTETDDEMAVGKVSRYAPALSTPKTLFPSWPCNIRGIQAE